MAKRPKILHGNNARIDSADEIASFFATQAITQAQGWISNGNIPVIDDAHVREAKSYVDKMHL